MAIWAASLCTSAEVTPGPREPRASTHLKPCSGRRPRRSNYRTPHGSAQAPVLGLVDERSQEHLVVCGSAETQVPAHLIADCVQNLSDSSKLSTLGLRRFFRVEFSDRDGELPYQRCEES